MSTSKILKGVKSAPELNKNTYTKWSKLFEMCLFGLNVQKYIEGVIPELNMKLTPMQNEADHTAALITDNNIKAAILQLVPDEVYHIIESYPTSRDMWIGIKTYFQPQSSAAVDALLEDFWGFSMSEGTDVDEYANGLTRLQSQIASLDASKRPSSLTKKNRLLKHFETEANGFYGGTVSFLKLNHTVNFAETVNVMRESQRNYLKQNEMAIANLAKVGNNSPDENKKSCAYCGRKNHIRDSCFEWLDTVEGSKWAAKNPSKASKAMKLKSMYGRNKKIDKKIEEEGAWVFEQDYAFYSGPKSADVIFDTGATRHIFHDKSLFTSISPIKKSVQSASGHFASVLGIGSVSFKVYELNGHNVSKTITLKDVWYLPSCTRNLVSGSQLISKGYQLKTNKYGIGIYSSENYSLATARQVNGLFCFNTIPPNAPPPSFHPKNLDTALTSHAEKENITDLIHHRFAHIGPSIIKKINSSTLDLQITNEENKTKSFTDANSLTKCHTCNSCKQVEKINRGPIPRALNSLDLVHSDIWGKCRINGIFGSCYFVSFTDDASRESKIYLLKSTKDVADKFQEYKLEKELQTGLKIKALRFDGGAEYKKIKFDGIVRQISAPYTQHQNGVSERLNRTLVTMARCMLHHAGLPLRFWDSAIIAACYIRNRLPLLDENKTPSEFISGSIPIVSHMKVWGCICYVLINKSNPNRYKLSPTSIKGIFIGYCESSTQYRVYIPTKNGSNKIIVSANVRFHENDFWDWTKSSGEQFGELEIHSDDVPADNFDKDDTNLSPISDSDSDSDSNSDTDDPSNDILETSSNANPEIENQPPKPSEPVEYSSNKNITESQAPRRSNRIRTTIPPRSAWQPQIHYVNEKISIPQSYQEAVTGPNKVQWESAIHQELDSLSQKRVFTPIIHVPHGRRPIGSRWVFSVKSDGRFKARLVAQGFSQIYGVDYFDTYSPTLHMDSLRILLAVAAFNDWEVHQIDVKTAYLEGELTEDIFMRTPEGLKNTSKFVKINKSLYGLKQSGKAWYEKLNEKLVLFDFQKSVSDPCIYIHTKKNITIGVYVDDLIICGLMLADVTEIKNQLSLSFPIKDLGLIDTVIGWKVTRDRPNRALSISQSEYILGKIDAIGLSDAKEYYSPLDGYSAILPAEDGEQQADNSAYPSAIGSLGYASNSTRPDICFATSQLARFNSSPVLRHWKGVCRVYRYLKATHNFQITYKFGPPSSEINKEMMAVIFSDSDFASDISTRRSVSGYVAMLGGGPICWQSKRQKSVATSTTEAEYIALFEASKQSIWIRRLLTELKVANKLIGDDGMRILTDNQSSLALVRGTNSTKAKHIDVAYHFARDCVQNNTIKVDYIPTNEMLADILTKPLVQAKIVPMCKKLFGQI